MTRIEAHMDGPHWVFESDPNYGWKPVLVMEGGGVGSTPLPISPNTLITSVTIPSGSAYSNGLDVRGYSFGMVLTPDSWTSNPNLGISAGFSVTGAFAPMRDDLGALLECTGMITGSWSFIPSKTFPASFIRFRAESGTVPYLMPRSGDRVLWLQLKS